VRYVRVCVECNADMTLVRTLGFRDIVHGGNKSEVAKYVRKHDGVVGLVDEDPGTIVSRDLQAFEVVSQTDDMSVLELKTKRIVQVRPNLEEWILRVAREEGVDVGSRDYSLPDDAHRLHKVVNSRLDRLESLVHDLRKSKRMRSLVEHLRKSK
jgi:hypothetical protein